MTDDLYQTALLRLASDATGHGRLAQPQASVTLDNPLCGDRIVLDLSLTDGHVSEIGHDVRACVLCQAAASLVGQHAPGSTPNALRDVARQVAAFLRAPESQASLGPWDGLNALRPAAHIKSRHACILLPFRALEEALTKVTQQ